MTVARLCPDSLLARARRGVLTSTEWGQLHDHMQLCESCRVALAIGSDFDAELVERAGDEQIAARLAEGVLERRAPVIAPFYRRRTFWIVLAAGLVVSSVGFAAVGTRYTQWFAPAEPDEPAPAPAPEPVRRITSGPVAPMVEEPVPIVEEPAPVREAPSARELFSQANASRRRGESARAVALYGELQRAHPRSSEAIVSRVSMGRVLLDRMRDPRGALRQFDLYLGQSRHTALTEEALFGRATACERLGNSARERATWETLLRRFPDSVYADRARSRLDSGD
jgi:hypothetical protein